MPNPILPWDDPFKEYRRASEVPFETLGVQLGKGGFATVDMVRDTKNKSSVYARKTFTVRQSDLVEPQKTEMKRAIVAEFRTMLELSRSPYIVTAKSIYTVYPDKVALIMEPVASHSNLDDFMKSYRNDDNMSDLERNDARMTLLRSFTCLSSAINAIHHNGFRHRDLKPNNCLIHHGNAILADFGESQNYSFRNTLLSSSGEKGMAPSRYTAPEAIRSGNGRRNAKADIFSLGCIFVDIVATLLGDDCAVDPWFPTRHGSVVIRVQGSQQHLGRYGDASDIVARGLCQVSPRRYSPKWVTIMTRILPSMIDTDPDRRPWADELIDEGFFGEKLDGIWAETPHDAEETAKTFRQIREDLNRR